jgi:hypothetical protein
MAKKISLLVLAFLMSFSGIVCAGTLEANHGSRNDGLFLSVGYDGSSLSYKEYDRSGLFVDKDTGWQNGVDVEARYETKQIWTRGILEYSGSNNSKYEGYLISGAPLSMKTPEDFYRFEFAIGYKILNIQTSTLTPYIGIGYRDWRRGENALPDYLEKYTWGYIPIGWNYVYRLDNWTLGADAAIQLPFSMKMKTDMAGLTDPTTFNLESRPGFRAELPITVDIYKPKLAEKFKVLGFLTPYYQYWGIGASNDVTVTSGGVPVFVSYEPKSNTNIFGLKVGLGVNF